MLLVKNRGKCGKHKPNHRADVGNTVMNLAKKIILED